jgi:hypothetical protein
MNFRLLLLLLLPMAATAQVSQLTESAPTFNEKQFASPTVTLKNVGGMRMDAFLLTEGDSIFLVLTGSGKGTGTIDIGNETILLLEDDHTVTARSVAVQGFETGEVVNRYRHAYAISPEAVELLSRYRLQRLRKYAMQEFAEIEIEEGAKVNFRESSAMFLQELEKLHLRKAQGFAGAPSFPGGKEVFLQFLNRNIKIHPLPEGTGTSRTMIRFDVKANGSVENIEIMQAAAPAISEELLRVLKRMPRWKPAFVEGKPSKSTVTQELSFHRQDGSVSVRF